MVVVVMSPAHLKHWEAIHEACNLDPSIIVAHGGSSRYDSVKNGLAHVAEGMVVGIHDAVRPLVSRGTLERTYSSALSWGSGIPVIDMDDSLRMLDEKGDSKPVDRARIRRVQTPQVFRWSLFAPAHRWAHETGAEFTDDGGLLAVRGHRPTVVPGDPDNWKVTTAADWARARERLG